MCSAGTGLSPRVRGNRTPSESGAAAGGSIPACAGEPILPHADRIYDAVYPRVCGGTAREIRRRCYIAGLSPRVRGNQGPVPADFPHLRSIPACAGEPAMRQIFGKGDEVYPRVCGGTSTRKRASLML